MAFSTTGTDTVSSLGFGVEVSIEETVDSLALGAHFSEEDQGRQLETCVQCVHNNCCLKLQGQNLIEEIRSFLKLQEYESIRKINGFLVDTDTILQASDVFNDDCGELILVIQRNNDLETDSEGELEVNLFYEWEGDSFLRIILHKIFKPVSKVKEIEFKDSATKKIRRVNADHFLTCRDGKLILAPIKDDEDDNASNFREYRYTALQRLVSGEWTTIHLRTFRSISENKYITVKQSYNVELEEHSSEYSKDKPDGRFFKLIKHGEDVFLECMIHPCTLLSWNKRKHKVGLKIFCPKTMKNVEDDHPVNNLFI